MTGADPPNRCRPPCAPTRVTVLLALERAQRHEPGVAPGVADWTVLEHLDVARRSAAARAVRVLLEELREAGAVERRSHRGRRLWRLSAAGREQLRRARGRGPAQLPESPQHRAWRHAHTAAALEITHLRGTLEGTLERGARLLAADRQPHSDDWFELADALHAAAWRVGSASHCLYEWAEPDDERADVDDLREPRNARLDAAESAALRARRAGRRNIALWRERRATREG